MSRFQKNALLTLIFLAAIAYPPLYYSIKNTIQKESLPKSYNAPELIPKVSFLKWKSSKSDQSENYLSALQNITSYEFEKMTNLVFLHSPENEKESITPDIALSGVMDLDDAGIAFTAEASFPKLHKSFSAEKLFVSWNEVGNAPFLIAETYTSLVSEKIQQNRFLLLAPRYNRIAMDLNPEILSNSEFLIYRSIFNKNVTDAEKLTKLNQLRELRPNIPFLAYESLLQSLKMKGESAGKDLWKEWSEKKYSRSPFSYLFSYEIGNLLYNAKDFDLAFDFFQFSRRDREEQGKVYHTSYADALSKIGRILVTKEKLEEALFYFTSAKEMMETLSLIHTPSFQRNQIHFSLLLAMLGQREVALNEFYRLENSISEFTEFEKALFYYNFARLQYSLHTYDSSLYYINQTRKILLEIGLTNHPLNFHSLLLLGSIYFQMDKYNLAQPAWEEILGARTFLPIEDNRFYRQSLLNMALVYQRKNSISESDSYYKLYTRLSPYNEILSMSPSLEPQLTGQIQVGFFDSPVLDEFTMYEETIIKSYTGRYIFNGQEEEIRARTYQDRLEDTNEFLHDLIEIDSFGSEALAVLKKYLFPSIGSYAKGENVVFIDIGPALNNLDAPGITSQSVAFHFPKMNVILWELPSEVDLFLKKVPTEKKEALYSFQNVRIIGADGVGNFRSSYEDPERWLFKNRSIPKLEGKTVILRAANSIDIYETFTKIQPHFKDVGSTLKENPVLYFFNRSILFKPKGSVKFTVIGNQSVRGFHHNFQSLDRNGEPPYTLAKYTLTDK